MKQAALLPVRSELNENPSPGKTTAKPHYQHQVPGMDGSVPAIFVEGKPHRAGSGITVTVQVKQKLLLADTGLLGDVINNPDIGLMGNYVCLLYTSPSPRD